MIRYIWEKVVWAAGITVCFYIVAIFVMMILIMVSTFTGPIPLPISDFLGGPLVACFIVLGPFLVSVYILLLATIARDLRKKARKESEGNHGKQ